MLSGHVQGVYAGSRGPRGVYQRGHGPTSMETSDRNAPKWTLVVKLRGNQAPFPTKTETALKDGLDPTVESIGVVKRTYREHHRLSTLDAANGAALCQK